MFLIIILHQKEVVSVQGSNLIDMNFCTIYGNSSFGLFIGFNSQMNISNSIIWDNGYHQIYYRQNNGTANLSVQYSNKGWS